MRAAMPSQRMTSSMATDPMWADWSSDMVREQEAHQAQIDRMLSRRYASPVGVHGHRLMSGL